MQRIDELTGRLETARATNHKLEQECEHLAQLVAVPLVNADEIIE